MNKFTIQKSFAISAGAGSGKTYTLSRRYINALLGFDYFREDYQTEQSYFEKLKPANVNQIVTMTYTEAAALEMRGRIFELVSKTIRFDSLDEKDDDYGSIKEANTQLTQEQHTYVLTTLQNAYQNSSNAKISTIHSFCFDIIKANSDIAKIDTKLDIIKDDEKASELSKIIFDLLNNPIHKDLVLGITADISMFFISGLIERYVGDSKFRKHFDSFNQQSMDISTCKALIHELYPLPEIDEAEEELGGDTQRSTWFHQYYKNFIDFCAKPWSQINEDQKAPNLGVKKFPFATAAKDAMEKFVQHYAFIDLQKEALFYEKIEKLKVILHSIKTAYDQRLQEIEKIDFDTIILKTLEIMPQVKTNFKYIMVDEFQDTNEIQFEIVKNAMNTDTNLFVVGDSKQSIYSFQGAEIEVFNNAVLDKSLFSSIEPMDTNHRSDGVVLDNVNKIFQELLKKDENLQMIRQDYEADPQDLHVFKNSRQEKGSFKYLITSKEYQDESQDESDTITSFIEDLCNGTNPDYAHITQKISQKEKAIAIIFDSKTKMLTLKQKLREKGLSAKVSASENFYHTKEVNDIFNLLKAISIIALRQKDFSEFDKYYLAGAMRSNVLKIDDNSIKKHFDNQTLPEKLKTYVEIFDAIPLAQAVKYVYDDSNIMGVYSHFDDVDQRVANLYKFLSLCLDYQNSKNTDLRGFLTLLENSIYFSEAKEDEAFFKSDNTKSIELCSIHATKGLAYPLVLLVNSDKGLYSQITSDALKHNNVTINGVQKELVGFKIGKYTPLSHRILKQVDKLKHLAEKKRLFYVALTRAEHDVVISAVLGQKKEGDISLREDSYLSMICKSLEIDVKQLFLQNKNYCVELEKERPQASQRVAVEYVQHNFAPITFTVKESISATKTDAETALNESAVALGTLTHKIIELYWESFANNKESIFDKMEIYEQKDKDNISNYMDRFYQSEVFSQLENGADHRFELEFHLENKKGFIDLLYFDASKNGWIIVDFKTGKETQEKREKYNTQLNFYKDIAKEINIEVVDAQLLWL